MSSRKLKIENFGTKESDKSNGKGSHTLLTLVFNRRLSPLEASGIVATLNEALK